MTLGGGMFTAIMLTILYFSFINLPDGASHDPLGEAIGPWIFLSALGILVLLFGIVLWIVGFIAELAK